MHTSDYPQTTNMLDELQLKSQNQIPKNQQQIFLSQSIRKQNISQVSSSYHTKQEQNSSKIDFSYQIYAQKKYQSHESSQIVDQSELSFHNQKSISISNLEIKGLFANQTFEQKSLNFNMKLDSSNYQSSQNLFQSLFPQQKHNTSINTYSQIRGNNDLDSNGQLKTIYLQKKLIRTQQQIIQNEFYQNLDFFFDNKEQIIRQIPHQINQKINSQNIDKEDQLQEKLQFLNYINQMQTGQYKQIKNSEKMYPFNCIGRVIGVFQDLLVNKIADFPYGTGILIHPRLVLTSASNIYYSPFKTIAKHMFFQLQSQNTLYRVKIINMMVNENYFNFNNKKHHKFSLTLLVLQQNVEFSNNPRINFKSYKQLQRKKNSLILTAGYPFIQNQIKQTFSLYQYNLSLESTQDDFLIYKKIPTYGNVGAPLFISQKGEQDKQYFYLVGIHLGSQRQNGIGINLQQQTQFYQLIMNALDQYIIQKKYQQIEDQKQNQNQNLINNIFNNVNNFDFYEIKKNIKKLDILKDKQSSKYLKLEQFLKIYQNPLSYRNTLERFITLYQKMPQKKKPMRNSIFKNTLQKFIHLKLNYKQQQSLLQIILEFIMVCCFQQLTIQQQIELCIKKGKQFFILHSNLLHKTSGWIKKQQIQQNIIQKQMSFPNYLQLIIQLQKSFQNQNQIINELKSNKNIKKLQLCFLYNNQRIKEAFIIIQEQGINFQDKQILSIAAQIYQLMSKNQKSLLIYQKLQQLLKKTNDKNNLDYANSLYRMGHLQISEGNYARALNHFSQALQIKLSIVDQIQSITWYFGQPTRTRTRT